MSEKLSDWLSQMPVPVVVLDDKMDLVDASRAAYSVFHSRFRPADRERSLTELSEKILGNQTLVSLVGEATMHLTRLGSREKVRWQNGDRTYDIEVFTMPPEEALCFGLVFEDITQQILFERSRETSRIYLEEIIDSLPLGIVVVDGEMRITAINKVQQRFLQMNGAKELRLQTVGSQLMNWLPEEEAIEWDEAKEQLFEKREAIRNIEYSRWVAGHEHCFAVDLIPLIDKHGKAIGALHITEEITARKSLEAEVRESEVLSARLETLKQMVVSLNHVVNNTLTELICNIEVVRNIGDPLPEDKDKILEEVTNEAHSIAKFIRDLTDMKEIRVTNYLDGETMIDVQS